jgi:trehalose/maltose transport system substrate-binding protein
MQLLLKISYVNRVGKQAAKRAAQQNANQIVKPPAKPFFRSLFLTALIGTATMGLGLQASAKGVTLAVACGAVGTEYEICKKSAEVWAKRTGNKVNMISTPNDTDRKLGIFQQLLSTQSPDIDLFTVDVIWPGILGNHFLELTGQMPESEIKAHFPSLIENNTVNGRFVSIPQYVDAGIIYYRKDLLQKYKLKEPTTWQDLTAAAKTIQDGERKSNSKFAGFVFQGKAYEGLTCNALEWISSFGGGSIIDGTGKVTINNPKAAAALKLAASWIGTIAPEGVLTYAEEEARGVFQSGNAAFMRNWPYAWSLVNSPESPVKDKVGILGIPGTPDTKGSPTLGGWHVAVSKYSKNPAVAVELARFLAGFEEQKDRVKHGFNPTIMSLYKDPQVLKVNPFLAKFGNSLVTSVARPSRVTGADYNRVSNEFWNAVSRVLSKKETAEESLENLESKLNRLKKKGGW